MCHPLWARTNASSVPRRAPGGCAETGRYFIEPEGFGNERPKIRARAPCLAAHRFRAAVERRVCPLPPSPRARRAHELWQRIVEEKHRRLGMTRREFAESACGMAAALYVLNVVSCGSSDEADTPDLSSGPQAAHGSVGGGRRQRRRRQRGRRRQPQRQRGLRRRCGHARRCRRGARPAQR